LPFCVYGLAYGDLLEVDTVRRKILRVLEPSGRRVLRVLITEHGVLNGQTHEVIHEAAERLGVASEWRGGRHGAFDVSADDNAMRPLYAVIRPHVEAERLYWEWAHVQPFAHAGLEPSL
jgi:hypothetical protein